MTMPTRSRRKPGATLRARALRQGGNIAEARLWNELKGHKLGGFKVVRQFPIGLFFADFACRDACLVVTDVFSNLGPVCEPILAALDGRMSQDVVACDMRYIKAK
jgi:hypothetical protein